MPSTMRFQSASLGRIVLLEARVAADLLHGLQPARLVDVAHDHCGALGGEQLRRRAPIPDPAPVTSTTLSATLLMLFLPRTFLSQG